MSQTNLHPMLNIAVKAARAAGSIISRASMDVDRLTVTSKGSNDFVTEVDQAAEQAIIETILQAYPNHGILAEESGREHGHPDSDYVWIIDPLDGTTNFIHGLPQYAVSIAQSYKGRIEQAVVFDPAHNDLFYATKGRGAFLNDRRLRVSKRTRMLDALIGTGFPFRRGDNFKRYMKMFEDVMQACAGLRRPGAASLDLCYVAAGWYDGFFETGLAPWDIAAGSLIVAEAGGLIGNFTGEGDFLNQREVIAGNPKIFAQLVQMLNGYSRVITPDEAGTASTSSSTPVGALAAANAAAEAAEKAAQKNALSAAEAPQEPATTAKKPPRRITRDEAEAQACAVPVGPATALPGDIAVAEPAPLRDIPMTPAQALAAAFDPTPATEEVPPPVVVQRKTVRIRKADLPVPDAPAAQSPGATARGDRGDRSERRPPRQESGRSDARGPSRAGGDGERRSFDRPPERRADRDGPAGARSGGKPAGKSAGGRTGGFGSGRPAGKSGGKGGGGPHR
jgi:myo-inositol-1(or 4)-monophosphatase